MTWWGQTNTSSLEWDAAIVAYVAVIAGVGNVGKYLQGPPCCHSKDGNLQGSLSFHLQFWQLESYQQHHLPKQQQVTVLHAVQMKVNSFRQYRSGTALQNFILI